ncbi:MAG: hypothetical protein ACYCTL_12630 [Acidimicrobiales bacterium]
MHARIGAVDQEEQMVTLPVDEQGQGNEPLRGHVRVVYLGPVAPHWEVEPISGDESVVGPFRDRTLARLTLLPPHDPQFRRNRERVARDAEREYLELEWDLGIPEDAVGSAVDPSAGEPGVIVDVPLTGDAGVVADRSTDEPDVARD